MKKIIFILFFLPTFIGFAEDTFVFEETFDNTASLEDVKSKWTNAAVSKDVARLSERFSERGKTLEIKAAHGKGIQFKLSFPPTSTLKASINVFLEKESDFFFRNGLFALKSGDKYAVANIVSKCKGKNTAVIQHSERYSKRGFTPLETIPCGKWVMITLSVDCLNDSVIYKAEWDNWRWKKKTILTNKVESLNELIVRTSWRKNEKNLFCIDDIRISNNQKLEDKK